MKVLVFNDPHFAERPPASRRGNYCQQILAKLSEIVDFANEYNVDVIACTGDWFISKKPEATSYGLCSSIWSILYDFHGVKLTAIGNHDVEGSISHFWRSPLFMLCRALGMEYNAESGIVHTDYGQSIEIGVVNYDQANPVGIARVSSMFHRDTRNRILIVHGPIIPQFLAAQYPQPFLDVAVSADRLVGSCDYLFYGDIHDYHGVYHLDDVETGSSTTFCNLGSLARTSARELSLNRTIQAALLDTVTRKIQSVELEQVQPLSDVFRTEEIAHQKQQANDVDQFIDALSPDSLSFQTLTEDILRERIQAEPSLSTREKQLAMNAVHEASP